MKNILFTIIFLATVLTGCVSGNNRTESSDIYEGTGQGYRGPIVVEVRMNGGSITEIHVIESEEDAFVGGAAIEELIDIVIEYDTTDVDVISGATQSSTGFLEAVRNALLLAYK